MYIYIWLYDYIYVYGYFDQNEILQNANVMPELIRSEMPSFRVCLEYVMRA